MGEGELGYLAGSGVVIDRQGRARFPFPFPLHRSSGTLALCGKRLRPGALSTGLVVLPLGEHDGLARGGLAYRSVDVPFTLPALIGCSTMLHCLGGASDTASRMHVHRCQPRLQPIAAPPCRGALRRGAPGSPATRAPGGPSWLVAGRPYAFFFHEEDADSQTEDEGHDEDGPTTSVDGQADQQRHTCFSRGAHGCARRPPGVCRSHFLRTGNLRLPCKIAAARANSDCKLQAELL